MGTPFFVLKNIYANPLLCRYNLILNTVVVEGGGAIRGSYLHIEATDLTVDDGGAIDVSNGGHSPNQGPSKKTKLDIIIEIVFKSFLYEIDLYD